jgi:hypothetical protein
MKIILSALALVIAAPAMGQTAPTADPNAGNHAQHHGTDHSNHQKGEHDCKACCEKMKGKDGQMECKDKTAKAKSAESVHDHEGHTH